MNLRLLLALCALAPSGALAAHAVDEEPPQAVWPMDTTGNLSLLVVRERFRIYTDHCGREIPALRESFDAVMNALQARIRAIGARLLDSTTFSEMKQQPVSDALLGTLSAELADIRQDLENQDPELVCAGTLQSYRSMSDAMLEDFVKRTLAGVRITDQTLNASNARRER